MAIRYIIKHLNNNVGYVIYIIKIDGSGKQEMRNNDFIERIINKYKRNSVLFAKDYNISLKEIFNYFEEGGWLDIDKREDL